MTYAVCPSIVDVTVPGSQSSFDCLANFSPAGSPDACRVNKET